MKKTGFIANIKKFYPFYLMMLPGLLYILINNYFPMAGLAIAFKDVDYSVGIWKSDWVGFKNFEYLFKTQEAFVITRNTLLYNIVFIIVGVVVAVAVAIILNEIRSNKAKKTYQTLILIPYMISMVVVSYLVYALLNTESGFINKAIIEPLGGTKIPWYSSPQYWPVILVLVHVWKTFSYNSIIYLATLVGFDQSYYEAAMIDGAGRWQRIRLITLPLLKPTVIIMVLLSIGKIFYSDFGLFYQVPMNQGMLYDVTNTIDTYVYRGLIQFNNIGMSSAAGFYQSIVGFLFVLTANFIVRKVDSDSALF